LGNIDLKLGVIVFSFLLYVFSIGKYLFFASDRRTLKPFSEVPITYEEKMKILNSPGNGSQDIYWVDAKVIENLSTKRPLSRLKAKK